MTEKSTNKHLDADKAMRAVLDAQIRAVRGWRPWVMIVTLIGATALAFGSIGSIVGGVSSGAWITFLSLGGLAIAVGVGGAVKFRKSECTALETLWTEVKSLSVQPTSSKTGSD